MGCECHFMLTFRKDVYINLLKRTNLVHVEPFPHWLERIHKRTQKQTDTHGQNRKRHLSFHPFL